MRILLTILLTISINAYGMDSSSFRRERSPCNEALLGQLKSRFMFLTGMLFATNRSPQLSIEFFSSSNDQKRFLVRVVQNVSFDAADYTLRFERLKNALGESLLSDTIVDRPLLLALFSDNQRLLPTVNLNNISFAIISRTMDGYYWRGNEEPASTGMTYRGAKKARINERVRAIKGVARENGFAEDELIFFTNKQGTKTGVVVGTLSSQT